MDKNMKKLIIVGALLVCLFSVASAQVASLTLSTDKSVYQKNEVVYVHINTYDADGNHVSATVHVTIQGQNPNQFQETWMSTWPEGCGLPNNCDAYLVYYFSQKGTYTITAETGSFFQQTNISVVR